MSVAPIPDRPERALVYSRRRYSRAVTKTVPFDQLASADLTVEAVYEGGADGNVGDDPLGRLVPVGNQGGFRYAGPQKANDLRMVVLYTSGANADWPDALDRETGLFTYFGDNREPGKELHDTSRGGNAILRTCFHRLHGSPAEREKIPPFLLFHKASQAGGRDVQFLGLAVPSGPRNAGRAAGGRPRRHLGGALRVSGFRTTAPPSPSST
jgi:hypothetical protein